MEKWSSRIGALLALIGGAVGLGNFLRFPFQAAKWGGGAFLVPYAVALVGVGLPLVWIEMALGRKGAQSGAQSAPGLLSAVYGGAKGRFVGLLGVYVSLIVGSYYAYLMGWTLGYAYWGAVGKFSGQSLEAVVELFRVFLTGPAWVFWVLSWGTFGVILRLGLRGGVEKASLYGLPALFLLAIGLAIGTLLVGDTGRCATCSAWEGLRYLYTPRWNALTQPAVWLAATGQVFFSVGVGFAMYPVYAAFAQRTDIAREGFLTVAANTLTEVGLGGLLVIPLVAAFLGVEAVAARAGFGMGFEVMPYVLTQWGGRLLVVAWYLLLFVAALTSLLAMGWVGVTWLSETLGGPPQRWAWILTAGLALLSVPPVAGYSAGTLDLYDSWGGTLFLVVAALGHWWVFLRKGGWTALTQESSWRLGKGWRLLMHWGTPIFLGALLVGSFFQPQQGDWIAAFRMLLAGRGWPWAPEALPLWLYRTLQQPWNLIGLAALLATAAALLFLRRRERT